MKKKILILAAAALITAGVATVSAQTSLPQETPAELVYEIVEPEQYAAGYTVDANGNVELNVELFHVGDVNADGEIDVIDLQRLYAHLNNSNPLGGDIAYGDVNEDKDVDVIDLQRLYAHLNKSNSLYVNP